jgi:transposase-like protein
MRNRKRAPTMAALLRRRTWNEDEARQVLGELAASGETVSDFARRQGLVPQRLWWWQKRLGLKEAPASPPGQAGALAATFLPVVVRAEEPPLPAAALQLCGGVRVELRTLDGTSAAWVAKVLKALGATP